MFGREGGFPGFLGRGPRAGRGDVRAAILALLAEEPMHGYQIMRELGERSGGVWRPSPGSIYPTLQQLEDEELVRPETGDGGRRVFTLTDAGREAQSAAAGGPAPWEEVGAEGDASALELRDLVGQVMGAARQVAARRRARADRAGQGRAARRAPQALPHPRGGLPGALRVAGSRRSPSDEVGRTDSGRPRPCTASTHGTRTTRNGVMARIVRCQTPSCTLGHATVRDARRPRRPLGCWRVARGEAEPDVVIEGAAGLRRIHAGVARGRRRDRRRALRRRRRVRGRDAHRRERALAHAPGSSTRTCTSSRPS